MPTVLLSEEIASIWTILLLSAGKKNPTCSHVSKTPHVFISYFLSWWDFSCGVF